MKAIWCYGVACVLALAGCQSGMYSSNVSVEKNNAGVSDYTVVNSLDVTELSQSMPVIVESKPTHEKGAHGLNNLLWLVTLGIVPGVSSEAMTYDVTVKTPLGEKSGTCKIEASSWMGWLPIFIPYPGMAEERTANPKLPNADIEGRVRDKLVSNLVSQFPRDEYARLVAKNNSPELKAQRAKEAAERERLAKERAEAERIRLAKEAVERAEKERIAMRTALYEKTVEDSLAAIRKAYAKGRQYPHAYYNHELLEKFWKEKEGSDAYKTLERELKKRKASDWLNEWVAPRLGLSEADKLAGEALLSEFGNRFMPNAYANYEKKKEAAVELQQIFSEEFSEPWTIKNTSPKWNAFNKVLEKFVKARTEFFLCHDELCHHWLLSRFGVLTDKDFAQIDTQRLAVHLLPENVERAGCTLLRMNQMESKVSDFAVKYAPESNAIYQKMGNEFKEIDTLLSEVSKQRIQMDDVRYSRVLAAAVAKRNDLAREMNALSLELETWYTDHKTTEKSSEDVAKCDVAMSKRLKLFVDALPAYIKDHALGPIIANSEMIAIPGQRYRMQRTEVTQLQWMAVMGNNPSEFRGPDRPVENVSWDDCQEFIKRASQMDGRKYRLPEVEEWEFACRAGSTTEWGRRTNGECGPLEAMGWYRGNSRGSQGTQAVALKEPNAWGLFDMHGNVRERCGYLDKDSYGANRCVIRGGSWGDAAECCAASLRLWGYADFHSNSIGFRLAVSQE